MDKLLDEPTERKTLAEIDILAVPCRRCKQVTGVGCVNKDRHPLTYAIDALAFHRERVLDAWSIHSSQRMGKMDSTEKAMILYYAFVHMSCAVAAKSKELFNGKEISLEDIQAFFIKKATEELNLDKLVRFMK